MLQIKANSLHINIIITTFSFDHMADGGKHSPHERFRRRRRRNSADGERRIPPMTDGGGGISPTAEIVRACKNKSNSPLIKIEF